MSENKEQRGSAEVRQEYNDVCTKAGHIQYAINQGQRDLELLNNTLRSLQIEHAAAKKREESAANPAEVKE